MPEARIVQNEEDKDGLINKREEVVVPHGFYERIYMNNVDGTSFVALSNKKAALIDNKGEVVVPFGIYDDIILLKCCNVPEGHSLYQKIKDGVYAVKKNNYCGLINSLGEVLEPCAYDCTPRDDSRPDVWFLWIPDEIMMKYSVKNKVKIIGLGGAGTNVVDKIIQANGMGNLDFSGADFYAMQTNMDKLKLVFKNNKRLFPHTHVSDRAEGNPAAGELAAQNSREEIIEILKEYDSKAIIFVAGLGGGTGTGALPVMIEIAQSLGIATIAIVTTPFKFEGKRRSEQARLGVEKLEEIFQEIRKNKNTNEQLLVLPCDKFDTEGITLKDAFAVIDDKLVDMAFAACKIGA